MLFDDLDMIFRASKSVKISEKYFN